MYWGADEVAELLDASSVTGAVSARISAMKHFGLIRITDGMISVTKLSKLLLNDRDNTKLLQEAFFNAELYVEVFSHFLAEGKIPHDLARHLETDFGIAPGKGEAVASLLLRSALHAKLISPAGAIIDREFFDNGTPSAKTTVEAAPTDHKIYELDLPAVQVRLPKYLSRGEKDIITSWLEEVVASAIKFQPEADR